MARTKPLVICSNPEEAEMFNEAAASEGMETAAWVRHLLFKEVQRRAIEEGRPVPMPAAPVKKGNLKARPEVFMVRVSQKEKKIFQREAARTKKVLNSWVMTVLYAATGKGGK